MLEKSKEYRVDPVDYYQQKKALKSEPVIQKATKSVTRAGQDEKNEELPQTRLDGVLYGA